AITAILQTIALPTELPRRDPHSIRYSASEWNGLTRHGVGNHVWRSAMVSARQARRRQDHCATCRYQTIETIALLTPLSRPICTSAASEPAGREPWRGPTIAFRARRVSM